MRELIKSMISFSWIMPLFGAKLVGDMLTPQDSSQPKDQATTAFDAVTGVTKEQLGNVAGSIFRAGDTLQRGMVDMMFNALSMGQPNPPGPSTNLSDSQQGQYPPTSSGLSPLARGRVDSGRLNTGTFIVLGEGLAAGMGNFTLSEETQKESFPAQMARQMQVEFPQPLIQAPGLGNPVGFPQVPVRIPAFKQTTVLEQLPPISLSNLSVPGYKLSDALNLRPAQPLVYRNDAKQTASNLILGMPSFVYGQEGQWPTQLEYAVNRHPTFTIVELGYYDVLEAAVQGEPGLLPYIDSFRSDYARLLTSLKDAGSEVLVMTIPDPMDTAYFSTIDVTAKIAKVEPAFILDTYGLKANDLITVRGLVEIGYQVLAGAIKPLSDWAVLSADVASHVTSRVQDLNAALTAVAQEQEAIVYDLHAFFHRVKNAGVSIGSKRLTAEFLGGFYSLNGYYPGQTGHALIANEVLNLLNRAYGADFRPVDIGTVILLDPVAMYQQAEGPNWPSSQLPRFQAAQEPSSAAPLKRAAEPRRSTRQGPPDWEELKRAEGGSSTPLQLPPGLEQVLPLSKEASYFGDAILAIHCQDEAEAKWGSCENLLFGGLALLDSHLSGHIRIRFTPPVNNVTHFEVTLGDGLAGDDSILAAPQFFKLPARQSRVVDIPGLISSGDLNLQTGEVSNPKFSFTFANTALLALVRVNPRFPQVPIEFPGQYGSAYAKFEQRPDGKLDFIFYGSTFLPLGKDLGGDPLRFPLPFATPTLQFASIPSSGTVLHPHIQLSTKAPEESVQADYWPDIPFNSIQELTLHTHNSCFGDKFTLDIPQLGGTATGRSHILGRALIQFGEPSSGSVPVAVLHANAGGLLAPLPASPISESFPAPLPPGPRGFDAALRFPLSTFRQNDLAILDDPFDLPLGLVDLKTGRLLNEMLHRGFINLNVIYALLRVEPRTPKSSFFFRGPAYFEKDGHEQLVFRYLGEAYVPYPGGFKYPTPNLVTAFTVESPSRLDPYLWIRAIQDGNTTDYIKEGQEKDVIATSTGERFSFSYVIPGHPGDYRAKFEYENHTQKGSFRLHSLTWVGFSNSLTSRESWRDYDTVTFAGFGVWSKDGVDSIQQAAVQISTSSVTPYVGIQIGSGYVSNVDTKPDNPDDAQP